MYNTYGNARAAGYERLTSVMRSRVPDGWQAYGLGETSWVHVTGAMIVSAPRQVTPTMYAVGWRVGVSEHPDGWRTFGDLSSAIGYGLHGAGTAGYVYARHERPGHGTCEYAGRAVRYGDHEQGRKCPHGCPGSYTVLSVN